MNDSPIFEAKTLNIDPAVLANLLPNASIHDFDLNLISFTVGKYKLSRTGARNA